MNGDLRYTRSRERGMMNRYKTFLLLGLILIILTGCSNSFAKKEYRDTDKIAATEDRYVKECLSAPLSEVCANLQTNVR